MQKPAFSSVKEAAAILDGVAHVTPVMTSRTLDSISGARAFLKCENFQRSGAFKFRGAYHAVTRMLASHSARAFATVSSGNHAQGLALACYLHGAVAHVVMPEPVNPMKHRAVLGYGATVYVTKNRADAEAKLRDIVENTGVQMVHPFNDPLVIAGQGTVMMELLEQAGDLDAVLAPVGGGGLLSGLCLVGQACRPNMKIYACEPAGALDAIESVRQNRVVPMEDPRTMAEGLRTSLGDGTLPILRKCLEGFFVVQEEEIVEAMTFAYERLKLVIEPSSAVALVPLLRKEPVLAGRTVGVVLSGGNVDLASFWRDLKAHALPATPS